MKIKRFEYDDFSTSRLAKYYLNIKSDLKLWLFLLLVIAIYRIAFMGLMAGYMNSAVTLSDILLANWTGLRLSFKSAGGFALVSFLLVTIPNIIKPSLALAKVRHLLGTVASFILAVLFMARFPYYQEFNMTYGLQVAQGLNDDRSALFMTMVQEYGLVWRLAVALVLTLVSSYLLKKWLTTTAQLPRFIAGKRLAPFGLAIVTALFMLVVRFGGGVNYATGINWENAAVTSDDFLNECILDDVQAMYRAYSSEKRLQAGDIYGVDKNLAHSLNDELLNSQLTKVTTGAKIAKPKHIFIIMGESWAQWPMLAKYADLQVADGIKGLATAPNGYYTDKFMPNGDFTSVALTGMITGLVDVNIRANYQPQSFEQPYLTALARPFHELGYKVKMYYGGTPAWDNIKKLALAQGFDAFYGYPDFDAPKTNTWGTNDANLMQAVADSVIVDEPTVYLIMTTSNHPPYDVDVAAAGFDLAKTKAKIAQLIPDEQNPEELALELGHYWYMDKVVTEFVKQVYAKYPDSLFVITGDHAVRSNPGPHPTMFEFQSVPFVLYGQGVTPNILPANAVGGHTSITPTLLELIAPAGFSYQAIAEPLGVAQVAFNRDYYLTDKLMGKINGDVEALTTGDFSVTVEQQKLTDKLGKMRTWAYYLLTRDVSKEK